MNPFILKNKQILKIIFIFIFINFFSKLALIESIPAAITYDELYYATQAQSIKTSLSDSTGLWRPWHLAPANKLYSELTGLTIIPGFFLFPNNPVLAIKLMSVITGTILVITLGLISFQITKNKNCLILTMLIATFNPWIFQFSRMTFDSLFSVTLYSVGILFLLAFKKLKKIWAILPFFLGFFQYQGHKPLLIPLIVSVIFFQLISQKENKHSLNQKFKKIFPSFVLLFFSLTLTLTYLYRLPSLNSASREAEFSIFSDPQISSRVNYQRRLSFPNPLTKIIYNKYTVGLKDAFGRYLKSYNPSILFFKGDETVDTYSVTNFGFFHYIDLLLIILIFLFFNTHKQIKKFIFLPFFIILSGGLTNAIKTNGFWTTFRGSFIVVGLVLLFGIYFGIFINNISKHKRIFLLLIYLIGIFPFFYNYFYHYPILIGKNNALYDRILANYIYRQNSKKHLIITEVPEVTFDTIAFYNKLFNKKNIKAINQAHLEEKYFLENIEVNSTCSAILSKKLIDSEVISINSTNERCLEPEFFDKIPSIEISSIIDSGTKYKIFNDDFCSKFHLQRYPFIRSNKFNIEKLSDQDFCQTYFTKK